MARSRNTLGLGELPGALERNFNHTYILRPLDGVCLEVLLNRRGGYAMQLIQLKDDSGGFCDIGFLPAEMHAYFRHISTALRRESQRGQ